MKGNHQEQTPLIKFTPEVATEYQVQQYARQSDSDKQFELLDSSSPATVKNDSEITN
jgi:hypothetical protein